MTSDPNLLVQILTAASTALAAGGATFAAVWKMVHGVKNSEASIGRIDGKMDLLTSSLDDIREKVARVEINAEKLPGIENRISDMDERLRDSETRIEYIENMGYGR